MLKESLRIAVSIRWTDHQLFMSKNSKDVECNLSLRLDLHVHIHASYRKLWVNCTFSIDGYFFVRYWVGNELWKRQKMKILLHCFSNKSSTPIFKSSNPWKITETGNPVAIVAFPVRPFPSGEYKNWNFLNPDVHRKRFENNGKMDKQNRQTTWPRSRNYDTVSSACYQGNNVGLDLSAFFTPPDSA